MPGRNLFRVWGQMGSEHQDAGGQKTPFRAKIAGMDCGSCALTIEDGLRKLGGVRRVAVDFTTETLEIEGPVSRDQVEQRLRQLGYRLAENPPPGTSASNSTPAPGLAAFTWRQPQLRVAVAGTAAVLAATTVTFLAPSAATSTLLRCIYMAVAVCVGAPIFVKGLRALIFSGRVTIDLLMTIAAFGALLIGEAGEAATVALLFTFGEGLEAFSASRARDSLRSLIALQPQTATLIREQGARHADTPQQTSEQHDDDHQGHDHDHKRAHDPEPHDVLDHNHGQGQTHDHKHAHDTHSGRGADACQSDHEHEHNPTSIVPAENLSLGDRILIRPGERIAADGVIRSGESSINEAAVTGESLPVSKSVGDAVMSGTVNMEGALEVDVTRKAADSAVARIARLVEQAQAQRSPAERFIDRFARWYTPAVVALSLIAVLLAVFVFHQPLLDGAHERGWIYRGLALLIVACPCALVISIPVTVVSSLTRLAGLGVLVKGGEQLDRLAEIRVVAFDKTGTLTRGRPSVTAVQAPGCEHEVRAEPACADCEDVIALAATVERSSEHPIAYAIMESAQARGLGSRYPAALRITAVAGRGVVGDLRGSRVAVGSDSLLSDQGAQADLPAFTTLRQSSRTVMTVALDSKVVGAIGVEDTLRAESRSALQMLSALRPAIRTVMLTGDNKRVADDVAARIGTIDEVRSGLLPGDKLSAIQQLQTDLGPVAMVGDGINDAPALARADVGIAMGGGGTAQAMETADVVLMQDDLQRVLTALRLARKNRAVIKQNIALSLGLKVAFFALVIPGLATLWLAVLADVGATVLVTLNGMRMLREN